MATTPDPRFDVNGPGIRGNLFGLPYTPDSAAIVIVPVPWEVTVSYGSGTAKAPEAILKASVQIDLAQKDFLQTPAISVAMVPVSEKIHSNGIELREMAKKLIAKAEASQVYDVNNPELKIINEACEKLNLEIKTETLAWLKQNKMVGVLGGDHSTSIGFIRALGEHYNRFGILQIDAHCDLRKSYEGFTYSHASAMFNALKIPSVLKLVQVGIRDYSEEELGMIDRAAGRVRTFFDQDLKEELFAGTTWAHICDRIVSELPALVYVSFDIDGLDPKLCPHTGTPVPGGLEFEQAIYLVKRIVKSGKKIIGFDLCEVSAAENEWDANVGARILYQLCHFMNMQKA